MSGIKPLAQAMEVKIKPYPPRSADSSQTYANVIHYLIAGKRRVRGVIGQKFGTPAGTLFEVSIKSNLLILLYQSGEDQGRSDSCAQERDRPAGEFVDGRRRRQQQGARGRRESQDA